MNAGSISNCCLLPLSSADRRIGRTVGSERNQLAIRAVATFGVVASLIRQLGELARVQVFGKQIEALVVIPGVPSLLSAGTQFQFFLLLGNRCRVVLRAGIQNAIPIGMNPGAGRFAVPGRDSFDITGCPNQSDRSGRTDWPDHVRFERPSVFRRS